MSLEWESIDIDSLKKKLDVFRQARNDGSNQEPASGPSDMSVKENEIQQYIKTHYLKEIGSSVVASEKLEKRIRICKELTKEDGHKQLLAETKSKWDQKFLTFKADFLAAKNRLADIKQKLKTFRVQNNIFAGREPMERTKFKLVLTIFLPLILASIEIGMNISILSPVTGGASAISTSFMVSIINVGFSFLVGRLCLTNLFHPVSTSASQSLYYFVFIFFLFVLVYVNLMMGVFRGSMELAQNAAFREGLSGLDASASYAKATQQALQDSVFPFLHLGQITFESVMLILVGFFFGLFSVLDGYYFDDPINGYGSLGRKKQRAETEFDRLRSEGPETLRQYTGRVFGELEQKRDSRRNASSEWGDIIDELQADSISYDIFCANIDQALKSIIGTYRTTNVNFRTEAPPDYFEDEIDTRFIEDFPTAHRNIKHELRNDSQKEEKLENDEKIIDKEYKETFEEYTTYFDEQRQEMFKVVEV